MAEGGADDVQFRQIGRRKDLKIYNFAIGTFLIQWLFYPMITFMYVLFGRDLEEIPCFRSSLLTGLGSGLTIGLGRFLFTSKVKSSADFGIYSFVAITLGYWFYCRYNWSAQKMASLRLKAQLREYSENTGTDT